MMDQNEQDSDGYHRYVSKRVFIEDLSDQDLIDELTKRERILVVSASKCYPISKHRDDSDCMAKIQYKLVADMGDYLSQRNLVAHEMWQNTKTGMMEYTATVLMMTLLPEENIV